MDSFPSSHVDSNSPIRRSFNSSISNLVPDQDLNIIRTISNICSGLTFVSGVILPESQENTSEECKDESILEKNKWKHIVDAKMEMEVSRMFKIEELLTNLKSNWEDIKLKNNLNKQNIELLESNKMQFIKNTTELQKMCDHSLTVLRNLESQTKTIEEYIYPYQQYNVLYHKLQNGGFIYNLNEVSNCFEIIDNSINFFQEHNELKYNDYYTEGYRKLRIRLCNMMKNFMKNILYDNVSRNSIDCDMPENTNFQQILESGNCGENKSNDRNMSLYYTKLRAKGTNFNKYLKLLIKRFYITHQNDVYKSTLKEMEDVYINYRLSDECFGIKAFVRSKNDENYLKKNSKNCLTLNLKNYTKLALKYCKCEWIAYNSFFNYDEIKNRNEFVFPELSKFKYSNQTERKSVEQEGINSIGNLNFTILIERIGEEYCSIFGVHVKEICFDPEMLRESINYLSQDILNISNELYQTIYFPDIYLSAFLHYVVKLQTILIEQLLFSTEMFIKKNIIEYELKENELNYPEILYNHNADKKLIKSLQSLPISQNSSDDNTHLAVKKEEISDAIVIDNEGSKLKSKSNKDTYSDIYLYENEVLTNISFPPNTIRLQTSSDLDENNCEDDYFGSCKNEADIKEDSTVFLNSDVSNINTIKVSIGSHPVVKNSLLALSYLHCIVPSSTFSYLNDLIIQRCCTKLISAKDYIGNNFYKNDKISRLYHCNLFVIRNLLYLKYELIATCKQSYMKENDEIRLIGNISELSQLNENRGLNYDSVKFDRILTGNSSSVEILLGSIANIIDLLIYNHLEDLINNACSNISLPLTKIVLQVHPEIQENDISELQCTSHSYIKDSIHSFWRNLKLHVDSYILKYMDIYLSIAGKQEMEALFSQIFDLINDFQTKNEQEIDSKKIISNEGCKRRGSFTRHFSESEFEKLHLNNVISSVIPSSLYIFLAIKKSLLEGVVYEFDHVLHRRLGIETNVVENELGWKLAEILDFLGSTEEKLRETNSNE
ncbi:hypothetical protein FG386_003234 [Cryptosporidium ryanae]|uniref:uncharacterized protein n=1 Tax=Cryptosporidium ryanae TaxID=515981 RepID=UPI00351A52C3|nr:hypothetical protein FG386_003234 [Cryptosporidium ryanae]